MGVSGSERIEQIGAQPLEMGDVARYQSEVMDYGSGGEEAVNCGYVADGEHLPPSIGDGGIDRQNVVGENSEYPVQPGVQVSSLRMVSATGDQHNALANFADGKRADEQVGNNNAGEPSGDSSIATRTAARLRNYVGVKKEHYSSTSREYSGSRVKSMSSMSSMGQAINISLKLRPL